MKKIYFLIYLINLSLACKAQVYFNKRYDNNSCPIDGSYSILVDSLTLYSAFATLWNDGVDDLLTAGLLKMDLNGNIIDLHTYGQFAAQTYIGGSASLSKTNDGFLMGGSYVDSINSDILLYKLNNSGDSVWLKRYGDTAFQGGWMAKQISDGNYVLCGEDLNINRSDMYLMKTDTSGNLIWGHHYGSPNSYELGIAFTETIDHGFALAGFRVQSIPNPSYDIYIVKTDSLGVMQWDTILGNVFNEWNEDARTIISTHDGNIVFAGNYTSNQHFDNAYIAKMDLSGNILWEKKFGNTSYSNEKIYSIKELANGSIIAVGTHNRPPHPPSKWGFILKVDSSGDSLWQYSYANTLTGNNELWDIYQTPDGGFVASGFMVPNLPDTGNQDAWYLKIDSLGCEVANCTVSIPKLVKNDSGIKVFPNPFSSDLNIELKSTNKNYTAHLQDVLGNTIKTFSVIGGTRNAIKLDNVPDGVYFILIEHQGERIYMNKLIHSSLN